MTHHSILVKGQPADSPSFRSSSRPPTQTPIRESRSTHVLKRLRAQIYPRASIEVIPVVDEENPRLKEFVEERFPWVKVVLTDDPSYYAMKTRGIEMTTVMSSR